MKAKKVVAGSQSKSDGFDYRDMLLLESEKENIRGLDNVKDQALPMRKSSFDTKTALLVHECSYSNRLESVYHGSHGDERSGVVVKNAVDDTQRLRDVRLELAPDQAENNRLSGFYPTHNHRLGEDNSSSLRHDHGSFAQPVVSSLSERYSNRVMQYDLLAENKAAAAPYEGKFV